MCIGWPMQVLATRSGFATVCRGTEQREVRTALVEPVRAVQPGDWLLVFLDDAREHLSPERAGEITATLALVQAALATGGSDAGAPFSAPFELPSAMSAEQLQALR
ncbi:HypC/HybG/HupF family hydrogenase formation chaperone [Pseudorhodoferax sp.]|uniref:HypC/HybG/HupF family hydrogenase formation chaperone n=1 Tax=Pseudorhodoferax sp. TaxID=1993553 RepID=UPI002DD61FA4|nr:HypC/HybG/HupF family hydrogenase formation chaperone [Pseudorhodoferax sp.]